MAKFYFIHKEDETCGNLESVKDFMRLNEMVELEVFEAKIEKNTGMFWCKEFGEIGEVGQGCGKTCVSYKPRNKISGRCNHSGSVYGLGNKVSIKL